MRKLMTLIFGIALLISLSYGVSAVSLVPDCTACTCPPGQTCNTYTKQCEAVCSDGTLYNKCSTVTKPKYCQFGSLIDNCESCGCPSGQLCNEDLTCSPPPKCSDGTLWGECSITKPQHCEDGTLVNRCQSCGCPTAKPDCYPSGECRGTPILTGNVQAQYNYNADITITVATTSVDQNYKVSGKITDTSGNTIQEIATGTWTGANQVTFYFNPISKAGTFTFKAWVSRPVQPYDNIWSPPKDFKVKAPLKVEFTISDPQQYTVRDAEFRLVATTTTGEVIPMSIQVTASVDGFPLTIQPRFVDEGSGAQKIIIPKENLVPGIMEVKVVVTDQAQQYESVTKIISNIKVTRPTVKTTVTANQQAQIMDVGEITVSTADINGFPLDIDTLELTITYPDGITKKVYYKNAFQDDFYKFEIGKYQVLNFQFVKGGRYQYHAVATKALYASGANDPDPITVVTGSPGTSCDTTEGVCDPGCDDDPDCIQEGGVPWWMWAAGGGIFLVIIIFVVLIWRRSR
jgi:hypothetical protein